MSFVEKLSANLKSAMLARDVDRVAALRMLKSAIGYMQLEKKTENLSDVDALAVVQREAKKRRDSIVEFERAGREELAAKERAELKVLEEFLPQPLSPTELEALVRTVIGEVGAASKKDMGAVMKAAQVRAAGRADGKTLSAVVSRLLP
jgi:uncharacterized protein YqeY